jgi:hypothetical protein
MGALTFLDNVARSLNIDAPIHFIAILGFSVKSGDVIDNVTTHNRLSHAGSIRYIPAPEFDSHIA